MQVEQSDIVEAEHEVALESASLDPKALLERTNESPMTELDSVDKVKLSDEERAAAEEAAAEAENQTKAPSRPNRD